MDKVAKYVADAILGIDTLWGGDVMCASGTGRFIADSWFSDEPLPEAYTLATAGRIRKSGGVTGEKADRKAIEQYLKQVDIGGAVVGIRNEAEKIGGLRGTYLTGLALCMETMLELAMETLGKGEAVSYERCVKASTGKPPEASKPERKREKVAELLRRSGYLAKKSKNILPAVDAWRRGSRGSHGVGAGAEHGGDCALRSIERGKPGGVSAAGTCASAHERISSFCRSRRRGFPGQ